MRRAISRSDASLVMLELPADLEVRIFVLALVVLLLMWRWLLSGMAKAFARKASGAVHRKENSSATTSLVKPQLLKHIIKFQENVPETY